MWRPSSSSTLKCSYPTFWVPAQTTPLLSETWGRSSFRPAASDGIWDSGIILMCQLSSFYVPGSFLGSENPKEVPCRGDQFWPSRWTDGFSHHPCCVPCPLAQVKGWGYQGRPRGAAQTLHCEPMWAGTMLALFTTWAPHPTEGLPATWLDAQSGHRTQLEFSDSVEWMEWWTEIEEEWTGRWMKDGWKNG